MKSPEKVLKVLEHIQEASDGEIAEAVPLPLPPSALRMALAAIAPQVPGNAAELDGYLTKLGEFCLALRSDPVEEPASNAV